MYENKDRPAKPLEITEKGKLPHIVSVDGHHHMVPEFVFLAVKVLIRDYDRYRK